MIQKKLPVFIGVALISIAAGLVPPSVQAGLLFKTSSYYFIFALFFIWLVRLISIYRVRLKERLLRHYPVIFFSIALTTLIFINSPPQFKVLADETNLIGISKMMHENRTTILPIEGISTEYRDSDYLTIPAKRPIFFPFLLSVVHALTGYAATNGFILNFVISCGILILFYLTTIRLLPITCGRLAVLLAVGAPIYMINVTSSGFEALNLLFILFFSLFLIEVFHSGGEIKQTELLLLTTLLLAQCRYESAVFIIIAGICLLPLMFKSKFFSRMSYLTCMMPIFLVPVLWQRKLFMGQVEFNRISHEMIEVAEKTFSLGHLGANFDDNIFVLLGLNPAYGFTPILSILAISGIYMLIKTYIRKDPVEIRPAIWVNLTVSAVLLFLIISSYFWGNFGLTMDNRLALAFLPFLVWPAVYALYRIQNRFGNRFAAIVPLFVIFHIIFFWPIGSQQRLVHSLSLQYEYNRVLAYLEPRYPKHGSTLIIAEQPNLYIVHNYSAMRFNQIHKIKEFLSGPNQVDHIIALQKIEMGNGRVAKGSVLSEPFEMEPLETFHLTPEIGIRISSCRLIDPNPDKPELKIED
jgi:hypothetical protein